MFEKERKQMHTEIDRHTETQTELWTENAERIKTIAIVAENKFFSYWFAMNVLPSSMLLDAI